MYFLFVTMSVIKITVNHVCYQDYGKMGINTKLSKQIDDGSKSFGLKARIARWPMQWWRHLATVNKAIRARFVMSVNLLSCLHQSRQQRHCVLGWYICSSLTKLVNKIFWRQMNQFWCKLAEAVYGASVWNYQLLRSRGQSSRSHEAEMLTTIPFSEISQEQAENFNQT